MNKMFEREEDLRKFLDEVFGEDVFEKKDYEVFSSVKGECGVYLFVDSDMYENGIFVVNDEGMIFGFEGNYGEMKSFSLDKESVVGLLCEVLRG